MICQSIPGLNFPWEPSIIRETGALMMLRERIRDIHPPGFTIRDVISIIWNTGWIMIWIKEMEALPG